MIRARTWRALLKRQSTPKKHRRSTLQVRKDNEAERLRKLGTPDTWSDAQVAERNEHLARVLGMD
jgi:hypothetical protein